MPRIWILWLMVASMAGSASAFQREEEKRPPATMTVNGRAEIFAAPDEATVQFGVNRRGPSARQVQEGTNSVANRIVERVTLLGINREDIQTSELSLTPLYAGYRLQEGQEAKITGYNASNMVSVRLTELSGIGPVIDAALDAGANQMLGVRFGLRQEEPVREQALRKAVSEARRKAELLAEASAVRLLRLLEISEGGVAIRAPVMFSRAMSAEAADTSTPVLPGRISIEATVTLRYEIGGP